MGSKPLASYAILAPAPLFWLPPLNPFWLKNIQHWCLISPYCPLRTPTSCLASPSVPLIPLLPLILPGYHPLSSPTVQWSNSEISWPCRISSVGRALDCRAGGRGFDYWNQTITQDLKITGFAKSRPAAHGSRWPSGPKAQLPAAHGPRRPRGPVLIFHIFFVQR